MIYMCTLHMLCRDALPDASCQVSKSYTFWFWRRRFLFFSTYSHDGHLGQCDLDHLYKLLFPLPMDAPHEVWLGLVKQFQRRRSLNIMNIYIYIALGRGQTSQGFFLAILGRGPRAFLIGKISDVNPEFGKFSECSKLIIFSNLT